MRALVAAGLCSAFAAACPAALAGLAEDFDGVRADWQPDGLISRCHYSKLELERAREIAGSSPEYQYTGLPGQIDRELARVRSRRCRGRTPESVRRRSPLAGVRIVRVRALGRSGDEEVALRSEGRTSVQLAGAVLRDARRALIRLPRRVLGPGETLTVVSGCPPRARRPANRVFACNRRGVWADVEGVVRLADRSRLVVSQRAYGGLPDYPAF